MFWSPGRVDNSSPLSSYVKNAYDGNRLDITTRVSEALVVYIGREWKWVYMRFGNDKT